MSTDNTAALAEPELITLQNFFTRFSITKSTWYRLAKAGGAPPIVKIGRRTLVPLHEAREWLATRVRPAIEISRGRLSRSPGGAA